MGLFLDEVVAVVVAPDHRAESRLGELVTPEDVPVVFRLVDVVEDAGGVVLLQGGRRGDNRGA